MTPGEFKIFIYTSTISADNESLTEDVKQDLISRYKEKPFNWEYIFDILPEKKKIIELFEAYEKQYKESDK